MNEQEALAIDEAEIRFRDLLSTYYFATGAHRAAEALVGEPHTSSTPRWTSGRDVPLIHDEDLVWARRFEDLIDFYSVLEISLGAKYIDLRASSFWDGVWKVLSRDDVAAYYTMQHPMPLVRRLQERLSRIVLWGDVDTSASAPAMAQDGGGLGVSSDQIMFEFLTLDRIQFRPIARGVLLRVLDGYDVNGLTFSVLEALLRDEERLAVLAQLPATQDDDASIALWELGSFLGFCLSLEQLLKAIERSTVKAAIEDHYSYWFDPGRSQVSGNTLSLVGILFEREPLERDAAQVNAARKYRVGVERAIAYLSPGSVTMPTPIATVAGQSSASHQADPPSLKAW